MEKYIDSAVEQFRTLITEQLARQNRMEQDNFVKDFKTPKKSPSVSAAATASAPL